MGIGLIVTIVMLGALLGLCARQTIGDEVEVESEPTYSEDAVVTPSPSSAV